MPTAKPRSHRSGEPGTRFVYMNQDGSVRELSPAEQKYLSDDYSGADGERPYIKTSCDSRDGWGSLSGFIERAKVPAQTAVLPVHADFDARSENLGFDRLDPHRAAGDIIEARADGSVSCTPNPRMSPAERFELMRRWHLDHQSARERLALAERPDRGPDT